MKTSSILELATFHVEYGYNSVKLHIKIIVGCTKMVEVLELRW
jgi:hypothetical protein